MRNVCRICRSLHVQIGGDQMLSNIEINSPASICESVSTTADRHIRAQATGTVYPHCATQQASQGMLPKAESKLVMLCALMTDTGACIDTQRNKAP